MQTPAAGEKYGHYDIERELGKGAMGTVYLARDRRIGRRVALKTINLTDQQFEDGTAAQAFFARLQREAEVCGSLSDNNIVTLYEAGYNGSRISYLAMEYVEGETLLQTMKRSRPAAVPPDFVLRVARDVLAGLAHAHAQGIIHRDIKPTNILVTADGTAKVADFGIARPQHSSMTAVGALMGTPSYMSPEQVLGQSVTPKADLFSLGVMLFEMLTATKPFVGDDLTTVLHNILRHTPPPVTELNPQVPAQWNAFVAALLTKDPTQRPSALEATALLPVTSAVAIPPPATAPEVRGRPIPKRYWATALGFILLTLIFIVVTIVSRFDSGPSVSITPAQLAEFAAKREELGKARALFEAGKYAESVAAYDAYLKRYPHSAAAIEGRADAEDALKTPATAKRRKPRDEDISPRELLRRIRRALRN